MLSLVLLLWAEVGALVTQVRVLPTQPLACLALDEASRGDHVGRLRLMVFGGGETTDQRTAARLLARNHSGWLGGGRRVADHKHWEDEQQHQHQHQQQVKHSASFMWFDAEELAKTSEGATEVRRVRVPVAGGAFDQGADTQATEVISDEADGSDVTRLARAFRDYFLRLAADAVAPSPLSSSSSSSSSPPASHSKSCSFPRAVTIVVGSAQTLSGSALALALKPFEHLGSGGDDSIDSGSGEGRDGLLVRKSSGTGRVLDLVSGGDGCGCDGGGAGTPDVRRTVILGAEVLVPHLVNVILLCEISPDAAPSTDSKKKKEAEATTATDTSSSQSLRGAQELLRRSIPRGGFRTELLKHRPLLVPFRAASGHWEDVAADALAERSARGRGGTWTDGDSAVHGSSGSGSRSGAIRNGAGVVGKESRTSGGHAMMQRLAALRDMFVGQEPAVAAVRKALSSARDKDFATGGLDGSPLVLAFVGPSGVGKTELAKQVAVVLHGEGDGVEEDGSYGGGKGRHGSARGPTLIGAAKWFPWTTAEALGQFSSRADGAAGSGAGARTRSATRLRTPEELEASGKLKRFPMNQYQTKASLANLLGADKGHVGQCNGALTNALRAVPDAVIVLDEFEKADPRCASATTARSYFDRTSFFE
jgi:hypothetical protein